MTYDPAFMNTASCRSAITYIDGDNGILEYRGYPIEQLAENSTYLEVAYLLVHGELPTQQQLDEWTHEITIHTFVHENVKSFMEGFRHDAHPMGMLLGSVGALSTFYPDANKIHDPENRYIQTIRLIAKMPTLAAFAYRHNMGQPYVYPDNDLRYSGNFLSMMYKMTELKYEPDPRLERALDILFILHADHEQNCSTSAVRAVGSSQVDPYSAVAAGIAALYGPLHGGANEAVAADAAPDRHQGEHPGLHPGREGRQRAPDGLRPPRLQELRPAREDHQEGRATTSSRSPATTRCSTSRSSSRRSRSRTSTSSRASSTRTSTSTRASSTRRSACRSAMFPVMFAIPRTSGWIAQWLEMVEDTEQKIARPRQIYTGERDARLRADRPALGRPRGERAPAATRAPSPAAHYAGRMRRFALGLLAAAALAGCGSDEGTQAAGPTGELANLVVTVDDDGARGRRQAASAQAQLREADRQQGLRRGRGLSGGLRRLPGDMACTDIFGGPETASVSGELRGEAVDGDFNARTAARSRAGRRSSALLAQVP